MNRKKVYPIVAVLVAYLLYSMALSIFSTDVVVARVKRDTAIKAVNGTVTVLGEAETQLLSSGHGFITQSGLVEGHVFHKGDTLAVIDPGKLPFNIQSVQAELKSLGAERARGSPSRISLRTLEREVAQTKAILDAGSSYQEAYDKLVDERDLLLLNAQKEEDQLEMREEIKKNELAELRDQLQRLTIVAPMNGSIIKVLAYPGDLMSVGGALADIISTELKLSAEINQDDIEVIKEGARADIRFFAYGDRLYKARVRQILPSNDKTTQRFTVYLDMLEEPENMMPGMTGEVVFFADEHPNAIIIPRQALLGNTVFVVDGSKLIRRKVKTGYLTYSDAEILEGLEEGELVVAVDIDFFNDGDRVHVKEIIGE